MIFSDRLPDTFFTYTNAYSVELLNNGKNLGTKVNDKNTWAVCDIQ